jgi:hypothetical protein
MADTPANTPNTQKPTKSTKPTKPTKPTKSTKSTKSTKPTKPTKRKTNVPSHQLAKKKTKTKRHHAQPETPSPPSPPLSSTIVHEKNTEAIAIHTKRIVGEGAHHIWIHMVGTGNVTVGLVMQKMEELQLILDNISKKPCVQFTFVFDFRALYDFADYATLFKFGKFMKTNQPLFESRLRVTYLLLRYWSWKATVKMMFAVFPPTKEVVYTLPDQIDRALCNG